MSHYNLVELMPFNTLIISNHFALVLGTRTLKIEQNGRQSPHYEEDSRNMKTPLDTIVISMISSKLSAPCEVIRDELGYNLFYSCDLYSTNLGIPSVKLWKYGITFTIMQVLLLKTVLLAPKGKAFIFQSCKLHFSKSHSSRKG